MEDLLNKLNIAQKHNHIIRLQHKNFEYEKRLKRFKDTIKMHFVKNELDLKENQSTINRLISKNELLQKENDELKEKINKLPNRIKKKLFE